MFEAVNKLLYKKGGSEFDADIIGEFNPFITTKCFSYYDNGKYCNYINETLNMYGSVFENIEDQYIFFDTMIPKLKFKRLDYIKKPKAKSEEEQPIPEYLSKREIELYESLCESL